MMTNSRNVCYAVYCVFLILFAFNGCLSHFTKTHKEQNCGKDRSSLSVVYEGVAQGDTYPWMGHLFYPVGEKRYITTIVLITRQIALGTALEIDKLPKNDFRARARAVFGYNCSGPTIPIRDYSYHPEYETSTYSSLVMIQLETDHSTVELHPICHPPPYFEDPKLFAMTLSDNCSNPTVKLYEMERVDLDKCRAFYRKAGLDISSIWPTYTICARALSGGDCVWRSGAVLTLKMGGRWRLLGFGVNGPGCGAPSRFLDYGAFHMWARRSIEDIGQPTISRVGPNTVVLRRSLSNLKRYGPCDWEETKYEIFTDHTEMHTLSEKWRRARYNVTLYAGVDYSCVVFRVDNFDYKDKEPKIYLRRWCAGAIESCKDFQYLEIQFYVEINYYHSVTYDMKAYGREAKAIDANRALRYINRQNQRPSIWSHAIVLTYMYKYNIAGKLTKGMTDEVFFQRLRWMNLRTTMTWLDKYSWKHNMHNIYGMSYFPTKRLTYEDLLKHMKELLKLPREARPHYIHGWDNP